MCYTIFYQHVLYNELKLKIFCLNGMNRLIKSYVFYRFPNGQRGESWTKFVQNIRDQTNWTQKAKSCLCSRHFNESCFDRTSQLLVRLWPTALPTIIVDRVKYVSTK